MGISAERVNGIQLGAYYIGVRRFEAAKRHRPADHRSIRAGPAIQGDNTREQQRIGNPSSLHCDGTTKAYGLGLIFGWEEDLRRSLEMNMESVL